MQQPEITILSLNLGNLDRSTRIFVGVALLALTSGGIIGAWGYIGIVPLLTGLVAFCPLYLLFCIRTTSR